MRSIRRWSDGRSNADFCCWHIDVCDRNNLRIYAWVVVMLASIIWPELPFPLHDHLFLAARRGSEAHGTYVPSTDPNSIDDRDIQAIVVAPKTYYFGLSNFEHVEAINAPWDVVIDEFRKFVRLLVKQNPNVLSILWLEPEDYLFKHPLAEQLILQRELFSSRAVAKSFMGYAHDQLLRMTHVAGRGYLGAKRKALVEKFGYDIKNAAHLIRLLHTGREFLETGKLQVKRTWDRDLIISIKRGEWKLDKVYTYAGELFESCRQAEKKSPLPPRLNFKRIDQFTIEILEDWFDSREKR